MRRTKLIAYLFFSLFLAALWCITNRTAIAANLSPEFDFSELDSLGPNELKEKHTPGAVITIISGDRIVYQKAFGVANVETNARMQPEMVFRLGSTTKMFTSV